MFLNRIIKLILLKNMCKQSVGAVGLRFSIELSKVHLWKISCRRPVRISEISQKTLDANKKKKKKRCACGQFLKSGRECLVNR